MAAVTTLRASVIFARHAILALMLAAMTLAAITLTASTAHAANWGDTSIGWATGDRFREPHNPKDIQKDVVSFTYAGGYDYGSQFFNMALLQSGLNDPATSRGDTGAVEIYVTYRLTLDFGKLSDSDWHFGPVKSIGLTTGFDWNTKNDVGYNSRKRMLVLGPTLIWDVPGHLETALLLAYESNAPRSPYPPLSSVTSRYTYDLHPMLSITWGTPLGQYVSFDGFLNIIAPKGRNEVGQKTGTETLLYAKLMVDISQVLGADAKHFLVGIEYQFWNNKFGNTKAITHGNGYRASTPMLRLEYHF